MFTENTLNITKSTTSGIREIQKPGIALSEAVTESLGPYAKLSPFAFALLIILLSTSTITITSTIIPTMPGISPAAGLVPRI